jgi:hypothetical protein
MQLSKPQPHVRLDAKKMKCPRFLKLENIFTSVGITVIEEPEKLDDVIETAAGDKVSPTL